MKKLLATTGIMMLTATQLVSADILNLKDKEQFMLSAQSPSEFRMEIRGQKHRTLYRTEYYESTCTRTESRTATRTECTPVYETRCHDSSREECSNETVCRDVMREVCNSSGCQSFPTRECTTERSCSSVPTRSCSEERVGETCRDVEYTEYYDVEYACTKSREIPIGTELVDDMVADVLVRVEGDLSGLTGKDTFELSIANGLDLSRPDLMIVQTKAADTHLFQLVKIDEVKKDLGSKQSEIQATFVLKIIPMSEVLKERTLVGGISVSKKSMSFSTSGRLLDQASKIRITVQKDKLIGGLKTLIDAEVAVSRLAVKKTSGGQKASITFAALGDDKLNGRPHEFTVSIVTDVTKLLGGDILNPQTFEKYRSKFTSSKKVRVNL